jgi:alkylhydroperoxidase family enzyme
MSATLLPLLKANAVPMETLRQRYGGLLKLLRTLVGVVPNNQAYLAIWPVGFRTCNVMVPNFLNLPISLWGLGAPFKIVSLAMYAASRTAECAYCSAHSCSFALRRGVPPESVAAALGGGTELDQRAAIAVARALSQLPATITDDERSDLVKRFPAAHVEWIILGIAMMGFLNKFMDAVGVELEPETVGEVQALITPSGWRPGKHFDGAGYDRAPPRADSLATRLSVLRYAPSGWSLIRRWTAGVPSHWPAIGEFLWAKTGHDFPVLSRLTHRRAMRAIAVMLRDNLDAATSVIGLPLKCQLGRVYAEVVGDAALDAEIEKLSQRHPALIEVPRAQAALGLAHAASFSPARIEPNVVEACRETGLGAVAIIEIIVWLSVLQMLHRLSAFYRT